MQFRIVLLGLLTFAVVSTATAQGVVDPRIRLSIIPQFGAIRGQAPLAVKATLHWSSPALLEGHLQFKWYVDRTHLGTCLSPEISLSEGSLSRSILIPPVLMPEEGAVCSVQAAFIAADRDYHLDIHDLPVPLDWRRTFVVGMLRDPELRIESGLTAKGASMVSDLFDSVRFEQFFDRPFRNREASTTVVDVLPQDFPDHVEQLLAFDLLIVPDSSLPHLSTKDRDHLATWVSAGGSLCFLIDGRVSEEDNDLLNRLVDLAVDTPSPLQTDSRSEPGLSRTVNFENPGIDLFRPGLGRLAVVRGQLDFTDRKWQQALLFLWKVREDRIQEWAAGSPWELEQTEPREGYEIPFTFEPRRTVSAEHLRQLLMPESIGGISLLTVALILFVFLLVIAPGDYLFLGWLRQRRWTWVLFPASSALFTCLMMGLAEYHLGSTTLGNTITIVDLARNGRPLRTSRIDLIYPGSNRIEVSEQTSGLRVPLDPDTNAYVHSRSFTPPVLRFDAPWTYTGNLPGHHTVIRELQQWAPRLARFTVLGADESGPRSPLTEFDWESIQPEDLHSTDSLARLEQSIRQLDPAAELSVSNQARERRETGQRSARTEVFDFVKAITATGDSNLFTYVSQVSPTGAGQWEDLALIDPSDSKSFVLFVMTSNAEGHYVVYRVLFSKES